jgi:hypothetical protein
MLTYADEVYEGEWDANIPQVHNCMLTYADVSRRMPTYADEVYEGEWDANILYIAVYTSICARYISVLIVV